METEQKDLAENEKLLNANKWQTACAIQWTSNRKGEVKE